MHEPTVAVADNLELDMMGSIDQFLDIDAAVSKRFLRLAAGCVKSLHQTHVAVRSAHPSATASRDRFDHHRIPDSFRNLQGLRFRLDDSVAPGRDRPPGFGALYPRRVLV